MHSVHPVKLGCSSRILVAGAAEGQRRRSPDEAIDLVSNAMLMRLSQMFEKRFVRSYERRHPYLLWGFRIVWGLVLLGVAVFALTYGSWLALLFLVAAAADFVFGDRIYRIAQSLPPT